MHYFLKIEQEHTDVLKLVFHRWNVEGVRIFLELQLRDVVPRLFNHEFLTSSAEDGRFTVGTFTGNLGLWKEKL